MSAIFLFEFILALYGVSSVPIVLKESTPNGESIIAISSSNPEVERYLANSFTSQRANPESSLLRSNFYSPESESYRNPGVKAFSFATPDTSISGTSRNFAESSHLNPFFVPFLLPPNLDGFKLNNWFRNIENVYEHPDASFARDGQVRKVTAVNDNGHVYGNVETLRFDNKRS